MDEPAAGPAILNVGKNRVPSIIMAHMAVAGLIQAGGSTQGCTRGRSARKLITSGLLPPQAPGKVFPRHQVPSRTQ